MDGLPIDIVLQLSISFVCSLAFVLKLFLHTFLYSFLMSLSSFRYRKKADDRQDSIDGTIEFDVAHVVYSNGSIHSMLEGFGPADVFVLGSNSGRRMFRLLFG